MKVEIMMSGIGGQGLQVSGLLLGTAAMREGKHVLQFSAYIGAMRGLNSETTTIISDSRIEQPPLLSQWSALVALDVQPFEEYKSKVKPGGLIVVNRPQTINAATRSHLPRNVAILEAAIGQNLPCRIRGYCSLLYSESRLFTRRYVPKYYNVRLVNWQHEIVQGTIV